MGRVVGTRKLWKKKATENTVKAVKTKVANNPKANGYVKSIHTSFEGVSNHINLETSNNISKSIKGTATDFADANDGFAATKSNKQIIRERNLEENPLNKYRTFNTIFTLAALNFYEINFPETLLQKGPSHIVAKSGGGGKRVTSAVGMGMDGDLELFIDNVNIDALVSPSPKNKHTQATGITFNVIEPYSMGKFLETLHLAAMVANDDDGTKSTNYFNAPYCLIIDFKGENDESQLDLSKNTEGSLRRIIPIRITSADFNVTAGGAMYEVSAIPWNEMAFSQYSENIPHDITLDGSTVHEVLQSGEKSLMNQLNWRGTPKPEVKGWEPGVGEPLHEELYLTMKKRKPNDYVIWFPTDNQLVSPDSSPNIKDIQVEQATWKHLGPPSDQSSAKWVNNMSKVPTRNKTIESIFGGKLNVNQSFQNGIQVTQSSMSTDFEVSAFNGNVIGKAKMVTDDSFYEALGKEFPDPESEDQSINVGGFTYLYDKSKKVYNRGRISFDPAKKHFTFLKGTPISDIIESVILLSDYGSTISEKESEPGKTDWFRVQPKVYQMQDSSIAQARGDHPKIFVFTVIVYKVISDIFLSPTDQASAVSTLENQVKKEYNYYYTGKNLDVLDFDLSFKFAFYQPMPSDRGDTPANQTTMTKGGVAQGKKQFDSSTGTSNAGVLGEGFATQQGESNEGYSSQDETPAARVARHFNDVIVNSSVDLVSCDLTIMGDTYWLPNSGLGNYVQPTGKFVSVNDEGKVQGFADADGDANFTTSQVLCSLNFRTPFDYAMDDTGGQMAFPKGTAKNSTQKIGHFSGLYRVYQVRSEFNSGKFVQILSMLRVRNQEEKEKKAKNNNLVKANPVWKAPHPHLGQVKDFGSKKLAEEKKDYLNGKTLKEFKEFKSKIDNNPIISGRFKRY